MGTLIAVIVAIELCLQAADYGLWGSTRLRTTVYEYGAFWPGLLGNWRPNFWGQPVTMFATYPFLHSGLGHLVGNVIMLGFLGQRVSDEVGQLRLAFALFIAALGAGIGYAALSHGIQPMVGISGAIFGLFGIMAIWQFKTDQFVRSAIRFLGVSVGLTVFNLLIYWWVSGYLAWQTHLFGFLFGAAIAPLIKRGKALP